MIVLAILCAMSFVMYIDRTNIATQQRALGSHPPAAAQGVSSAARAVQDKGGARR